MSKIALLPGEQVVLSSDNDVLVLTTKRVRYDSTSWGQSSLIGITLKSIASCGLTTRSTPLLIILAVVAALAALTQRGGEMMVLFLVAAAFTAAYFSNEEGSNFGCFKWRSGNIGSNKGHGS